MSYARCCNINEVSALKCFSRVSSTFHRPEYKMYF